MGRHSHSAMMGYDTQSNAYATINKAPGAGVAAANGRQHLLRGGGPFAAEAPPPDYATLEKYVSSSAQRPPPGPLVPGVHPSSSNNGSNTLPRPLRRADGAATGSNLVINRDGQPELVADLM